MQTETCTAKRKNKASKNNKDFSLPWHSWCQGKLFPLITKSLFIHYAFRYKHIIAKTLQQKKKSKKGKNIKVNNSIRQKIKTSTHAQRERVAT